MPVVHFTLSKSRAGKTFISWLLAQYQLSNGQPLKLYDLDPNFSLCRFKALNAKSLNLAVTKTDGSIDFDINKLVEIIKKEYPNLVDIPIDYDLKKIVHIEETGTISLFVRN